MKRKGDYREAKGNWTDGIIGTGEQIQVRGTFNGIDFTGRARGVYGGISVDFDTPVTYLGIARDGAYIGHDDLDWGRCTVEKVS